MLAVSFFFVLMGGGLFCTGVIGFLLQVLGLGNKTEKKWAYLSAGGFVSLILGLLIAMT